MNPEYKQELLLKTVKVLGLTYTGGYDEYLGVRLHDKHSIPYSGYFNSIESSHDAFNLMNDLDVHLNYDLGLNEYYFSWFDGEKTQGFSLYVGADPKVQVARLGITVAAGLMYKGEKD